MSYLEDLSNRSRYAEYRRRIDPEKVLDYYGAQHCFEVQREDGTTEIQHSCLLDKVSPHHANGDQNPSARMNLDKKLYICYGFGGGDIFWLIKMMEEKETFTEILPVLGQFLKGSTETKEDFLKELEGYFKSGEVEDESSIPTYSDRVLKQWSFTHPYLIKNRGVSHEAAKRLRVGFDIEENRIVFPLFIDGKLSGWQKRAIPPNMGYPATKPDVHGNLPKYKNTPGFPKSQAVYNLDLVKERGRQSVVVVESPMSVLKAETLTDGEDLLAGVVSTFGAKVSQRQIDILKQFKDVYVYMDSDSPGQKAAVRLVNRLYRHVNCHYVKPEWEKDLGDYDSREEVLSIINKAEPAFLALARWDNVRR